MSTERSCRIMKSALGLIPIIDTHTGAVEERVFNLFNHLSNDPIFRTNICVYFSPHNYQTLGLFDVVANRPTGLKLKRPNFPPYNRLRGSNLAALSYLTLIQDHKFTPPLFPSCIVHLSDDLLTTILITAPSQVD